jgi:hypothetical protein
MARMKSIEDGIKYTVVLPESDIQQLKLLASQKKISSINAGVREAVEIYLVRHQQEAYREQLREGMRDPEFIKRNEEVMNEFEEMEAAAERKREQW